MIEDETNLTTIALASAFVTVICASLLLFALNSSKGDEKVPAGEALSCDNSAGSFEVDKEVYPGGVLTIYYGSQTGTAESFALDIQKEGESHGFKVVVVDLEDSGDDSEMIRNEILNDNYRDEDGRNRSIFLMATYGEGEPTDNAMAFVNVLQLKSGVKGVACNIELPEDERDPKFFEGVDFAVFGLGNTQYEHYNSMGKLVDECLEKTGATRICTLGLGNDDDDLESDFEKWRDSMFWPSVEKLYLSSVDTVLTRAKEGVEKDLPPCQYLVEYVDKRATENEDIVIEQSEMNSSTKYYFTAESCPITEIKELRTEKDPGETKHIEIDISKSTVEYMTADNLAILPSNDPHLVEVFAKSLSYDLDAFFKLVPGSQNSSFQHLFPTPCSIRSYLENYCDLTSPLRRSELKLLAHFATDPIDKSALQRMSSKDGKDEYREKILDGKIGIYDIITRYCKSIKNIPLEHLVQICPTLQPRYYTISSSSSVYPTSVHITVAVIKDERKDGTMFKGVCSNYLAKQQKNIRLFCRDSSFRLPKDPKTPVIMVGPGTGIAPMRALLQERSYLKERKNLDVGPNILYFGCKRKDMDYLYRNELEVFQKTGDLAVLRVAFSRESNKKIYVQHLIEEDEKQIWEWIEQGAHIYVCGGIKMGNDVYSAFRKIAVKNGAAKDDASAKDYFAGRFVQELWA